MERLTLEDMNKKINLKDCKFITPKEYLALVSPEFMGQTMLDESNNYYMVWKCDGILYKTKNRL